MWEEWSRVRRSLQNIHGRRILSVRLTSVLQLRLGLTGSVVGEVGVVRNGGSMVWA